MHIPQCYYTGIPSLFEMALKVLMTNINGKGSYYVRVWNKLEYISAQDKSVLTLPTMVRHKSNN